MTKKKCSHDLVSLRVVAWQYASRDENGKWSYDELDDPAFDTDHKRYCYCCRCERYLTKEEVEKLGV